MLDLEMCFANELVDTLNNTESEVLIIFSSEIKSMVDFNNALLRCS